MSLILSLSYPLSLSCPPPLSKTLSLSRIHTLSLTSLFLSIYHILSRILSFSLSHSLSLSLIRAFCVLSLSIHFLVLSCSRSLSLSYIPSHSITLSSSIIACRNQWRGEQACEWVRDNCSANVNRANVEMMQLDLSSLDSVDRFSEAFHERFSRLHVLVNNAGTVCVCMCVCVCVCVCVYLFVCGYLFVYLLYLGRLVCVCVCMWERACSLVWMEFSQSPVVSPLRYSSH
jgi:hypothetical protein